MKNTIDDMKLLAKKHGGDCLSKTYIDARTRLTWKCKEGHIFEMVPSRVKEGRWCRICRNKKGAITRRIPMQEIREIASLRNGICISKNYIPGTHLEWECEYGHRWKASIHSVKKGSWCPTCGHNRSGRKALTIEEMQEIAASHGGQCLSKSYLNVESKLKWMCEKGHTWSAIPSAIKKGSWCPICQQNYWLGIEDMRRIAKSRGGKCLSDKYLRVNSKLKWQCSEGHTWYATYGNISVGRWCPECSTGLGERICKEYFEQIFGKKFPKTRPAWLINHDGFQMELDGYCEKLSLAFEHQGHQHYRYNTFFHSSNGQFEKRKVDDKQKKALCEERNILLLVIPQIPDRLPLKHIQKFILTKCYENGFDVPEGAENQEVKLRKAFSPSTKAKLKGIQEAASRKGGICLSSIYLGQHVKLQFRCEKGHEWETTPYVILKGHWCPECSVVTRGNSRRLTIEEMNLLAKQNGGRCLSTEYINANTHLLWECSKGHQWRAIPNSIKRGSWCAICSRENRRSKT